MFEDRYAVEVVGSLFYRRGLVDWLHSTFGSRQCWGAKGPAGSGTVNYVFPKYLKPNTFLGRAARRDGFTRR